MMRSKLDQAIERIDARSPQLRVWLTCRRHGGHRLKFSTGGHRAAAAVLLAGLTAGCASGGRQATVASLPDNVLQDLDTQVFDTVLKDLATFHEFQSRVPDDREKSQIVVHTYTRVRSEDIADRGVRSELRRKGLEAPQAVLQDLERRNTSSPQTLDYSPADPDIIVSDLREVIVQNRAYSSVKAFQDRYPDAKAFVHTWLPGYDATGMKAILRFRVGPQGRGRQSLTATGTYLLTRDQGPWEVSWRTIEYQKSG